MSARYFRTEKTGVTLFVRLTPRSAKDAIEGVEAADDGRVHLKARVRAVPEGGKANEALVKLLSKWLDIAPRNITIVAGAASRLKQLKLSGDSESLSDRLSEYALPEI